MKSKNIMRIFKAIIYWFIAFVQTALVTTVFVINGLTTKRAGVMRHVYSRGIQYKQGIYSNSNLLKHSFVSIILAILLVILLIYALRKKHNIFLRIQVTLGLIMSLLVPIVINSSHFKSMMTYSYFIMAFELVLLIQVIVILTTYLTIHSK